MKPDMVKTTGYLDAEVALQLRQIAGSEGRSQAALIREALAAYTSRARLPLPSGAGRFRSGRGDVAGNRKSILRAAWKRPQAFPGAGSSSGVTGSRNIQQNVPRK